MQLVNGAQPCNVFWQVGSSATLGTSTAFAGNILALTSISMNDGVTLNGRALARNGAVTLINDTITAPHCAPAAAASPAGSASWTSRARCRPTRAPAPTRGLRPNHLVEQVLVEAGVDPTRAQWTQGAVDAGPVDEGAVDAGPVDAGAVDAGAMDDDEPRRSVGACDLDLRACR